MLSENQDTNYTYKDYETFDEGFRCEIIDGVIYDMSPAPSSAHQWVSGFLFREIINYLWGKTCKVFNAPFDVFLLDEGQDIYECDTIVQPDISVICDTNKIVDKGCAGAPDFIIEIVSPSSRAHDYLRKLNLYNDYKVREYWIVNPENKTVLQYVHDGENFGAPVQFTFNDKVKVEIFEGLVIDFSEIMD